MPIPVPVLGPDPPKIPTNHFLCEVGTVTVENMGLGGVTVMLSGMADGQTTTDDSGQYSFTGLRAGTYSVEISSFDTNEVSFSSTSGAATVGVGESKVVSFDGTYLRTAGIQGQVSVDGEGLGGVTVTLVGEGEDRSEVTNSAGQYAFSQLKSGTYQVAITNPDPDDYEFATTSKTATIATGETANVPFEGTLLRTAGIAGRVSVEGMGLDGVTVTLAGAAEATDETANGGQYSFAGLAAGTYVLTISNPDEVAYSFDEANLMRTVVLADDQSAIENFEGTHTRTAQISGKLFIDEAPQDTEYNDGELTIVEALAPLLPTLSEEDRAMVTGLLGTAKVSLRGPDLNTVVPIDIQPDGSFTTGESLMAGTYQLELPVNKEAVAAALEAAGIAFVGGSMVKTVAAGGSETANFPFRITMQTLVTGAVMGVKDERGAKVPKVKLALYARADGTDMLGEGETNEMGMATFHFAREKNTGPAGNDNIVFVKVMEDGLHDDLAVSGNDFVEVAYAPSARLYAADETKEYATLFNTAVAFDFWVKNKEMGRGGDMGLGGWRVQSCMPMAKTDDAEEVVCEGDKAAFADIMMGEGDDAEPVVTNDGEDNMANLGKARYSYAVTDPAMLPAKFYVRVRPVDVDEDGKRTSKQPDMGEMWDPSGVLMHPHTGLDLPPGKDDDPVDLGPIRITFTTQSLTVGVYRETDDQPGFTDYRSDYPGGDHRPRTDGIEVELMYSESGGRLSRYDYMTFDAMGKRTVDASNPMDVPKWSTTAQAGGMVTFKNLPADMDFTVRLRAGSGRTAVGDRDVDAYGDELDDMSKGAFGSEGGALPEVRLCPLTTTSRPDFLGPKSDDCATFAYQWTTGTVNATLTGLRKDVTATLTLDPVTDVHSEGDDKDFKGNKDADDQEYKFSNVQDGVYRLVLTGANVGEKKSGELVVYHDESSSDDEYEGDEENAELSATSVRAMIKGVVGNNRTGSTLSQREAGEGVTVGLYKTKTVAGETVIGAAVTDDDGDAVTETTNQDGEYVFSNLAEKDEYFVKITKCEGCVAYHSINDDDEFVDHGLGTARVYADDDENTPPRWNHEATAVGSVIENATGGGNFVNFALLHMGGTVSGEVWEPFDDVDGHDIEIERCLTYRPAVAADLTAVPPVTEVLEDCDVIDDSFDALDEETDKNGRWGKDELREGFYRITVDPKGRFEVRTGTGQATGTASDGGKVQIVRLDEGPGSDDEALTVNIVNSRLSASTTLASATITADGVDYTVSDQDDPADGLQTDEAITTIPDVLYVTKTVTVVPKGPEGAQFKVTSTSADGPDSNSDRDVNKVSPEKGGATTKFAVSLAAGAAGDNSISVTVIAANGYEEGSSVDIATSIVRTAAQTDNTISTVDARYTAANGTEATENLTGTSTAGVDFTHGSAADSIPHNARGSTYDLDLTLNVGSAWAKVEYRIGDSGSYTVIAIPATDATRATRTANDVPLPAKGASQLIEVRVTAQDGSRPRYYTIVVNRGKTPTS